ncbi:MULTISPECIES: glutamine--fructose-6-phosphate transaminase (isomerizing) [Fervidobacterium]|uniref:Glutamine--fructose-6-phosphate aminotransferase [isomerizing] n=1 Tax=Fervidobacterium nodosum (strain ATCC 35602 / DSM 5306 / Rt17-B1) TaxID=381764 RepID=A7HLA8_FERNB|nr:MULTISPECIES: glutamine--fructose-6-phosphate transaminase (isomerizing) [Fervidobacterium]ABS60691.1 glucosamine--fructose-6-phosphate aminotransferase, isomerizing [Fervidobacterium nodosum Rt17-B1]KAF2961618.1 glutamine--fructose-6-phosphate aminotransferase [Fervidobacterium sp. 2310opik-2]PHJ13851.1 glucosamine--fructose-6-phosphate aminotransferase [Fervidobacterium sp. SC_NGM5_G05]HOJ94262.1 glutamine--fructose-6-phosphate transaminase (isomerizing) [Fervidobacterium nodosum]
MCGIVGIIGHEFKVSDLIDGLKKLEYRGYDSAGVAVIDQNGLYVSKSVGRIDNLKSVVETEKVVHGGIAHTRWATHGAPSDKNAHPHTDCSGKIAVVHNGIIENYQELKNELIEKGHKFKSDTDTEVISHLIEENFQGDLYKAVLEALKKLKGAFAIAVIHSDIPNIMVGARKGSPLVLGCNDERCILASDVTPIIKYTRDVIFLEDGDVVYIEGNKAKVTDFSGNVVIRKHTHISWDESAAEKGGFKHFMLKEIHEVPEAIESALVGRFDEDLKPNLKELDEFNLEKVKRILLVACGTSYHAGLVFKYFAEKYLDVDVLIDVASEFRYRPIRIDDNTLTIAISQSGETADTLESVRAVKKAGGKVIAITNVVGSTITRESDITLFMNAGPEIGVAASKTYVNQLIILYTLGLYMMKKRGIWSEEHNIISKQLNESPKIVRKIINNEKINQLADYYKNYHHFMYIGRGINTATAMEGALKLKEISYINAVAYPAGELKHGPIALLDPTFPVFAIAPKDSLYEKMRSNIEESRARNARILSIATEGDEEIKKISHDVIYIPEAHEDLYPLIIAPVIQLFAYYIADKRGYDPDKPRNLAKSVTVE